MNYVTKVVIKGIKKNILNINILNINILNINILNIKCKNKYMMFLGSFDNTIDI